jgi:hypothetical protein
MFNLDRHINDNIVLIPGLSYYRSELVNDLQGSVVSWCLLPAEFLFDLYCGGCQSDGAKQQR